MSGSDAGAQTQGDPEPVVRRAFAGLTGRQAWRKVLFTSAGRAGSIEVAFNDQSFRMLVRHAERQGLIPRLRELGFGIPVWWSMVHDRKRTLFSKGSLEVVVPVGEQPAVEALVHLIGREVFGWARTQPWSARLQR